MSVVGRVVDGLTSRSTLSNPDSWLRGALTSGTTFSGKTVTVDSSLSLVPVFAAVNRLSQAVGASPLIVYKKTSSGRERAADSRQWEICHEQPNPEIAADEFWAIVESHIDLWGNAFIWKERAGDGRVANLWALKPSRCMVGYDKDKRTGQVRRMFKIDGNGPYFEDDILQIRGLSSDGLVGYSPIQLARQLLGNGMAQEEFQGKFWANGAWPGVVLKHPQKLDDGAIKRLKASWKSAHGGAGRAGETAVIEEGMSVETMTMPLDDAQFIEQARFNDLRVAQLFGLPPHAIAAKSGDSMTYSNVESQGIDFVRWSVRPRVTRIEKSLKRDPDLFPAGQALYPEFLLDALMRADLKTRYEAYQVGIAAGVLTRNEARDYENLPALPDQPDQPDQGDPANV